MTHSSLVMAWIKEKQLRDGSFAIKANCSSCGYPHSEYVLCGEGAEFGIAFFGGRACGVDSSDVEYLVKLREKIAKGHHWKDDVYFYTESGHVYIQQIAFFNGRPSVTKLEIPLLEWETIVNQINIMKGNAS